ncbi:MAG: serine kinase, partial [Alphaproteobacteria bacterium]
MRDPSATSAPSISDAKGELVHASCVAWHGRGILLRGPSGAGKSALALRLIEAGALLVADDYVVLDAQSTPDRLLAAPPPRIAGLIEVRGLGLL